MPGIKLNKREVLAAALDEARRRLYKQSQELYQQRTGKEHELTEIGEQLRLAALAIGERQHGKLLAAVNKLLGAAFPGAAVRVTIDLERDERTSRYKRGSKILLNLWIDGAKTELNDEDVTAQEIDLLLGLHDRADKIRAEADRLYRESQELMQRARRFERQDLMRDLVVSLPDEGIAHLDALIGMIEQVTTAP